MKLNAQSIHHGVNAVKSFLHRGYHATKSFLGDVDHGVSIAKRTYAALSPFLDQLGASHRPVMKALEGYDQMKARAVDAHTTGEKAFHSVRAKVPELNFGI